MIIFANEKLWDVFTTNPEKFYIMNFLSIYNIGDVLANLYPPPTLYNYIINSSNYKSAMESSIDGEQFRINYLMYLQTYKPFLDILSIIMNDYYHDNVVILTDLNNNINNTLVDLISQFIYDRYMYQPVIVNDISDLYSMKQTSIPFERIGVFQADKEYYVRQTVDPKKLLEQIDDLEVANSGTV